MKNYKIVAASLLFTAFLTSCENTKKQEKEVAETETTTAKEINTHLKKEDFDATVDGKKVGLYYIKSDKITVAFTNYGARIVGLWVPDKNGTITDVVVGLNSTKAYQNSTEVYFGATIGRVGNRIAKGTFTLNNKEYHIPLNNDKNSLHGGKKGFQGIVWNVEQPNDKTLVFTYTSPDGEEGFPGNLKVKVTYSVDDNQNLKMDYEATTDQNTPVNLTNHAFFNLNGEGGGTVLNHKVMINADAYTPVDDGLIPLGKQEKVAGTPFDFTSYHTIGERIETADQQLKNGKGYDHNFALKNDTATMHDAATVVGDKTGIVMKVTTQEPGLQFYSGNFMQGKNTFKCGAKDDFRTAFAMETQHFPDAINQPTFASIVLEPGKKYHTVSNYQFSTEE
ncbi:aldose epimerase [Flavobacterium rivuli WB 3.3-2 = DSM 21788]|uniref:Aldose 1-epimerase n=1 Tax=Flavobacterium rivuli WB 3.3-2 = DSM 21788 TaxID=1121895 RepID=A0A0A2M8L5_9FLAO|nr:aldose epimerase family protein [Flavobacterium rivuli]KGO88599.1 aldose epimerase [Flavobacterium rivuli WB 3.3-2 = DSM 21788]